MVGCVHDALLEWILEQEPLCGMVVSNCFCLESSKAKLSVSEYFPPVRHQSIMHN